MQFERGSFVYADFFPAGLILPEKRAGTLWMQFERGSFGTNENVLERWNMLEHAGCRFENDPRAGGAFQSHPQWRQNSSH